MTDIQSIGEYHLTCFFSTLHGLVMGEGVDEPYLCLGEVEGLSELLPLGSHHVLVLLESLLQLQQLTGAERSPDPLGLPEGLQEISQLLRTCGRKRQKYEQRKNILTTRLYPASQPPQTFDFLKFIEE